MARFSRNWRFLGSRSSVFARWRKQTNSAGPRRERRSLSLAGLRIREAVPELLYRTAMLQPLEERVMLDIGGANSA